MRDAGVPPPCGEGQGGGAGASTRNPGAHTPTSNSSPQGGGEVPRHAGSVLVGMFFFCSWHHSHDVKLCICFSPPRGALARRRKLWDRARSRGRAHAAASDGRPGREAGFDSGPGPPAENAAPALGGGRASRARPPKRTVREGPFGSSHTHSIEPDRLSRAPSTLFRLGPIRP